MLLLTSSCTVVRTTLFSFSQIHTTASGEKTISSVLPWLVYRYGSVMLTEQFAEQPV